MKWWNTYSKDTVIRLRQYDKLRKNTFHTCLTGDSRTIDIVEQMKNINPEFSELIKNQKSKEFFHLRLMSV